MFDEFDDDDDMWVAISQGREEDLAQAMIYDIRQKAESGCLCQRVLGVFPRASI